MICSVVDPLIEKARMDVRYVRGMRCMHAERYLEYCRDLQQARQHSDWQETHRIIESLSAFSDEMRHLVAKHRSAWERLVQLKVGAGFPSECANDEIPVTTEEA